MASNIDSVIFLGKGKLAFYQKNGTLEENLLGDEVILGQYIRDIDQVSEKINAFFEKQGSNNLRIALVLDKSFVFEKYIDVDPKINSSQLIDSYLGELPILKQNCRVIALKSKDRLQTMVINWQIVDQISEILGKYGDIKYVGVNDAPIDQNLTVKDVFALISNRSNINWLERGVGYNAVSEKGTGGRDNLIKALTIFAVMAATASLVVVGYFAYTKLLGNAKSDLKEEPKVEISPSLTPTAEPTPTISYLSFEEMNVKVLNGSGIPGQAKEVSQLLSPLGIIDIETGNATESSDVVQLYFDERIKEDDRQRIKKILEVEFDDVSVMDSPPDGNDILIITGQ